MERFDRSARGEGGAAAVEMALLTPLLFLILFGILEFGVAFLNVQSIRTGVREGGRAAAVGAPVATTQEKTVAASSGSIPESDQGNVQVTSSMGGRCTVNNIGEDVTVSYDTSHLPGGGIVIRIPLIPEMTLQPVLSATFRCEV
jgi:uncharacterized iron-regulated membrane protein